MTVRMMTHMVAGYPDYGTSAVVAEALVEGGSAFLEVQFPFSDPTADGPSIQEACTRALDAGFRVRDGFRLVEEIRSRSSIPVFIMSYASVVVASGIDSFVAQAKVSGADGLIIPDLPVDSDEGLFEAGAKAGLSIVPVVVPTMREERVTMVKSVRPEFVYAALRTGITGSYTEIGASNLAFLDRLRPLGTKIFAGFGIRDRRQVEALQPHVHAIVAGSVFVNLVREHSGAPDGLAAAISAKARELSAN